MAILSFAGNLVAAVGGANDDGSGGIDLKLDQSQDLDGNGNPYYAATDIIQITIDDVDIGSEGELQEAGSDGKVTVTSIKVNGVEQLSGDDKIKFASGGDTYEGDAYFFVEGVKLFFLADQYNVTFEDAALDSGDLILNIPERVVDIDFDENSQIDTGTAEVGQGIFNVNAGNVVCFAGGTPILTPKGEVPIENLSKGDLVVTLDNGPRILRTILARRLRFPEALSKHKPIEFKPGSLGGGMPRRSLCVSPQHRMLVSDLNLRAAFGLSDLLIPAKGLLPLKGVRQKKGCRQVVYYHLVFDQHEVVFAEGAASESLYPGPEALKSVDPSARRELQEIFPELKSHMPVAAVPMARACIGAGRAARKLSLCH